MISSTADQAGYHGLWKLSQKMTNLALSWKFLQDVQEENIGVNEVEYDAWRREANREEKKGNARPKKKGQYSETFRRNGRYVKKQMEIRVGESNEDWEEARGNFSRMPRL